MNKEQKEELNRIVMDKYSSGAFAGMVFNATIQKPDVNIEDLILAALQVRLTMKEMVKEDYSDVPKL